MFNIGESLAASIETYAKNWFAANPQIVVQIEAARAALAHFVQQSNANAGSLEKIEARSFRMEEQLTRIENAVSGGLNLPDDALLEAAGALEPPIGSRAGFGAELRGAP